MFDSSSNLVFFKDGSLKYTRVNAAMAIAVGMAAEDLIGLADKDIYSLEVARQLEDMDSRALREGRADGTSMRPSQGGLETFTAVRIRMLTRRGELLGVFGIDRPSTAPLTPPGRVRTAQSIQPFLESSPLAVIEWDPDHRIVGWMGSAEAMFGWSANEVIGKRVSEWRFVYEEDLPGVERIQRTMDSGKSTGSHNRNYRKDGMVIHCEWYNSVVTDPQGRLSGALSLVLDVTAKVKAEELIRGSEERFRRLFEAAPTGIFRSTMEGRFLWMNLRLAHIFGYSSTDDMMQSVQHIPTQLFVDKEQRARIIEQAILADRFVNAEAEYLRRDGSHLVTTLYIRAVRDEYGMPIYFEGFVEDITERKKAEEAIREANAALELRVNERTLELSAANDQLKELDRLKSQFLASMSHELRTPLNSIIGFTSLLKRGLSGPVSEEQVKQLEIVNGCAQHLLGLINDLLDVSSIEAGRAPLQISEFTITSVLQEITNALTPQVARKDLRLTWRVDPDVVPVIGDRKRTFQVLLNLANNAVKFTSHGLVHIEVVRRDDFIRIGVSDTGIGIKQEHIGMLFEAFRQVDGSARRVYEGTGLGLYLCRKLLELMHGKVWVTSEYGKGSCFSFEIPIHFSYLEAETEMPS